MIVTRMGSKVTKMIDRDTDERGGVWVRCELDGMEGVREIHVANLRADGGAGEIDSAVNALPQRKTDAGK